MRQNKKMAAPEESSCVCAAYIDVEEWERREKLCFVGLCVTAP